MMKLVHLLYVVLVLALSTTQTSSYSMGAPDTSCSTMAPEHGVDIQHSTSPYQITLSNATVQQGHTMDVMLGSPKGLVFKGFLLQARDSADNETVLGTMFTSDGTYLTCKTGVHNSVTHRNSLEKKSVKVTWQAPSDFAGTVIFRGTFVQDYSTIWTNVIASPLRVIRSIPLPTSSSISTPRTTTTTSEKQTTRFTTTTPRPTPKMKEKEEPEGEETKTDPIYEDCYKTKGCIGFPKSCESSKTCSILTTYEAAGGKFIFELKGKSEGYVSVALSRDKFMGDDLVTECVLEHGSVNVYTSWNKGPEKKGNIRLENPLTGLSDISGSYLDGWITCTFTREKGPTEINGISWDLSEDEYYIMVASGVSDEGGNIHYHKKKRLVSGGKTSVALVDKVDAASELFIRLHGSFMVASWIGAASCGMLIARYFKQTWTGTKICGKDLWFVWHRFFMVITWGLTVAAFVLMFVELQGWTSIPVTVNPHAILGCITTGLCFIQPFMALLRPNPGAPRRSIFNWVHWLVGNSAQIVGIVAIFYAVELSKANLPDWMVWILVGYICFHGLIHFILSVHMCWSDGQSFKPTGSFPVRDITSSHSPLHISNRNEDAPGSAFRKVVLGLFLFVNWVVTAVIVLIVVLAPVEDSLQDWGILH